MAILTPMQCAQQYWVRDEAYRFMPVAEIAEAFRQSPAGGRATERLDTPFEKSDLSNSALIQQKYALSCALPSPSPANSFAHARSVQ